MGTLQSGNSPGRRAEAGNTVLERAKSVDKAQMKTIRKRFLDFVGAHRSFVAAHTVAEKAQAAAQAQQQKIGAADLVQDDAVHAWAGTRSTTREAPSKPKKRAPRVADVVHVHAETATVHAPDVTPASG